MSGGRSSGGGRTCAFVGLDGQQGQHIDPVMRRSRGLQQSQQPLRRIPLAISTVDHDALNQPAIRLAAYMLIVGSCAFVACFLMPLAYGTVKSRCWCRISIIAARIKGYMLT